MPLALFLISLLVSGSLSVSMSRVAQDSVVSQTLLASTAAFYTASSSAEVIWTEVTPETGTQMASALRQAVEDPQEYLAQAFGAGQDQTSLELNRGIQTKALLAEVSSAPDAFLQQYDQSSGEILLYDVRPEESITAVQVDYCHEDDINPCPPLVIEWFRFGSDFSFQNLETLNQLQEVSSPEQLSGTSAYSTYLSPCLEYPKIQVRRCVLNAPTASQGDLTLENADSPYRKRFLLRTSFPGYHYLLRFRSRNRVSFPFHVSGRRGNDKAPLPSVFAQVDEIGQARLSFRRIREQHLMSGGLQDGLEFVHFSEEMANK